MKRIAQRMKKRALKAFKTKQFFIKVSRRMQEMAKDPVFAAEDIKMLSEMSIEDFIRKTLENAKNRP